MPADYEAARKQLAEERAGMVAPPADPTGRGRSVVERMLCLQARQAARSSCCSPPNSAPPRRTRSAKPAGPAATRILYGCPDGRALRRGVGRRRGPHLAIEGACSLASSPRVPLARPRPGRSSGRGCPFDPLSAKRAAPRSAALGPAVARAGRYNLAAMRSVNASWPIWFG
jgi:hypothetical protein